MSFKKFFLTVFVISSLTHQVNVLPFKENIMQFASNHKTSLKRIALAVGIGFALHQTFKKLIEKEEKTIAVFKNDIVIKQITLKHLPASQTTFMMYKQGKYIGLLVSLNFGCQCILGNLAISKNIRNMGYGKLLLKTVVDKLSEDGFKEIYLDADPCENNENGILTSLSAGPERDDKLKKLIHFYEQNGFVGIDQEASKKKVAYFNAIKLSYPMKYKTPFSQNVFSESIVL